jgi:hypothetical protein
MTKTITRWHQREIQSYADKAEQQQSLSLQQEEELVNYIIELTGQDQGLTPFCTMTKDFASEIAWGCRESCEHVLGLRFMARHKDKLVSKWNTE